MEGIIRLAGDSEMKKRREGHDSRRWSFRLLLFAVAAEAFPFPCAVRYNTRRSSPFFFPFLLLLLLLLLSLLVPRPSSSAPLSLPPSVANVRM